MIGWNSSERMAPGFDWRIGVISQFTGAKRFGKQPRSYWILIQWICDAYDKGGMGAGGPLGIVIYLSRFSRDFIDIHFILGILLHTHKYTQIQTHMDKRFLYKLWCFTSKATISKTLVWHWIVDIYRLDRKDSSKNEHLMTG